MRKTIMTMLAAVMLLSTLGASIPLVGANPGVAPYVVSVTPSGASVDVGTVIQVTFSEAMDIASAEAAFSISGGVTGNSAWTSGETVMTFTPAVALAYETIYSVSISAGVMDKEGESMELVFSSSFTTQGPPDTTAPFVSSAIPSGAAINVSTATNVQVIFSEAMDQTSAQSAFSLSAGGSAVAGSFLWDGTSTMLSFTPSAVLAYSTEYAISLTAGAKDLAGNTLVPFSSIFTTVAATTVPSVTSITPTNGATGVAIGTTIQVNFSEGMNRTSVESAFSLSNGTAIVAGVFAWSSDAACTFTPSAPLAYITLYTITLGTGAKNLLNQPLAGASASTFTTAPDTTPPKVTKVTPLDGATYVDVNSTIILYFSEAMDQASVQSTFNLSDGLSTTPGSFTWAGTALAGDVHLTFKSSAPLQRNVLYTVSLSGKDLVGNLLTPFSSQFVTGASPDVTPRVLGLDPPDGATGVILKPSIEIVFSMAMNTSPTGAQTAFSLSSGGVFVVGNLSWADNKTLIFTPFSELNETSIYEIRLDALKAKSAAGVEMSKDFVSHFTTVRIKDTTPPTITCPTGKVNATDGIAFIIKDDPFGWGIEWTFLTVKDNGIDIPIHYLIINQTTGKVTIPAPNMVGKHIIEVTVEDIAIPGNEATAICNVTVVLPSGSHPIDPTSTDAPQLQCTLDGGQAKITWATTSLYTYPKLKCILYRGTSPDALSPLIVVIGTHYNDSSIMSNQQYYYQVKVIYELGEGTPSPVVGLMPTQSDDLLALIIIVAVVVAAALGLALISLMHKKRERRL